MASDSDSASGVHGLVPKRNGGVEIGETPSFDADRAVDYKKRIRMALITKTLARCQWCQWCQWCWEVRRLHEATCIHRRCHRRQRVETNVNGKVTDCSFLRVSHVSHDYLSCVVMLTFHTRLHQPNKPLKMSHEGFILNNPWNHRVKRVTL